MSGSPTRDLAVGSPVGSYGRNPAGRMPSAGHAPSVEGEALLLNGELGPAVGVFLMQATLLACLGLQVSFE